MDKGASPDDNCDKSKISGEGKMKRHLLVDHISIRPAVAGKSVM
jgi:hypothetical protein